MPTAMVTFNGRITLPSQVRRRLGLQTGDNVEFVEIEKGQFALKLMKGSVMEMTGCLPKLDHAHSDEDVYSGVRDAFAEDYMASAGRSI